MPKWLAVMFVVACSGKAPPAQQPAPVKQVELGPFTCSPPAEWTSTPPTTDMRAAQFRVGDGAELVVFYFGEGGAGSIDANIDRWLGQFGTTREGAKIEHPTIAGKPATTVFVSGHLVAEAMPGRAAIDKQDQALLAAIVDSPKGPYFFELKGDKAVVDANTPRFQAFVASLKVR